MADAPSRYLAYFLVVLQGAQPLEVAAMKQRQVLTSVISSFNIFHGNQSATIRISSDGSIDVGMRLSAGPR